jgi:hypothetical protein
MSDTEKPVKQYNIGIIAPRSFTDVKMLEELLLEKIFNIKHIYGNGVIQGGKVVEEFADLYKIPKTIFPIAPVDGGIFKSNKEIILSSDQVLLFDDGESKNVAKVQEQCAAYQKPVKVFKFVPETPLTKYVKLLGKIEKLCAKKGDEKVSSTILLEEITELIIKFKQNEQTENKTVSV